MLVALLEDCGAAAAARIGDSNGWRGASSAAIVFN